MHFNKLLDEEQKKHANVRRDMEIANKQANAQLAKEKRDRDVAWMADQQMQAEHDKQFTTMHDFMTENPATEQSSLAPHRVKPYHFKGLNEQQKAAIMNERENQLREAEMLKANEKEAEKLLAMQAEQQRRMQVLADRQHKRQLREVATGV